MLLHFRSRMSYMKIMSLRGMLLDSNLFAYLTCICIQNFQMENYLGRKYLIIRINFNSTITTLAHLMLTSKHRKDY